MWRGVHQFIEKLSLHLHAGSIVNSCRQHRRDNADAWRGSFDAHLRPDNIVEDRLFKIEDIVLTGGSREEMLWALEDKIPSQMRKTNE
jgi:hypothetical protein